MKNNKTGILLSLFEIALGILLLIDPIGFTTGIIIIAGVLLLLFGVVEVIKALRGKLPMFGVGLGMQLIALAYGAKTYKMKSGHCGGTHSIKMLKDGRMEVNSQNHFYAVCGKSVEETDLAVIAVDLIDNTVEAVECAAENVLGVQYYPDAAQGPDKTFDPFDDFADMMKKANVNDGEQVF